MKKDKIKVLFIVPSLARAGAENQIVNLVNGMNFDQFDLTLFTFEKNLDLLPKINQHKVNCINYRRNYKFDYKPAVKISRLIEKEQIHIVHCTLQIALLMGLLGCSLASRKPRLVTAIHTTINRDLKQEILTKAIYNRTMSRCDRIIFVCKGQAQYWKKRFPSISPQSEIIYNGVNTDFFHPQDFMEAGKAARARYGIPENAVVISNIACFRPEKGHRILLNAMSGCSKDNYLLLAGDGETKNEIRQYAIDIGLKEKVIFLDEVEDVRPVLAASDLFVLTSTEVETFSMAMLEAMSMEVPVVASDIGGLSEAVIPGETGYLFKPGDDAALTAVLTDLTLNREQIEKLGSNARQTAMSKFSKNAMIAKTESLFQTLMN